jgi:hypothetical protein
MALADLAEYLSKISAPAQSVAYTKATQAGAVGTTMSQWLLAGTGGTGVAPTTAAVPTRATVGAIGQFNSTTASLYAWMEAFAGGSGGAGTFILADRLSHQGGLDGTVTTLSTTNLPTAALTRYTSGEGVFAAYEIYTQIGTTATTITCGYTNQAGTAGRTSQPVVIGASNRREAGKFFTISLQSGDTGVRSVENSTLLASTGTAGAFGITLYKPLVAVPVMGGTESNVNGSPLKMLGGMLPEVIDDACLWLLYVPSTSTTTGAIVGRVNFLEA